MFTPYRLENGKDDNSSELIFGPKLYIFVGIFQFYLAIQSL